MNSSAKTIVLILSIIIVGIIIYPLAQWVLNVDVLDLSNVTLRTGVIIIYAILVALMNKLIDLVTANLLSSLEEGLLPFISGFKRKYLKSIVERFKNVDTKGLTIRGEQYLELEKVYVELDLTPYNSPSKETGKNVWEYLGGGKGSQIGKRFVIIGAPGGGKTTLLKQMAAVLAKRQLRSLFSIRGNNKIPIFITLRDCAESIEKDFDVKLPDLINRFVLRYELKPLDEWFRSKMHSGKCIVLMDGLDEIADDKLRIRVAEWIQYQMEAFRRSDFLITSRPYGYFDAPIQNTKVLEIRPFNRIQLEKFINNWYFENEVYKAHSNDLGIKIIASENAADIIKRINKSPALADLAVNPLLATMIATVHSFQGILPERRTELYKDIFDVFLRRRLDIWRNVNLSANQILEILKHLAYYMMLEKVRQIHRKDAAQVVREDLIAMGNKLSGEIFLKNVEDQSGLLLDVDGSNCSFAHLTYQEYLASLYILDDRTDSLRGNLILNIDNGWWAEVIRLYAAQSDATDIVSACLQGENLSSVKLNMALDCLGEALKISPKIRETVEAILNQSIDSHDPEFRAIAAKAKLSSRLRWMSRLRENIYMDDGLVSNIEYQFFLDEMSRKDEYCYPDQWLGPHFPLGQGNLPVVGVRPRDAVRFCDWLTQRDIWYSRYRIPDENDIDLGTKVVGNGAFWMHKQSGISLYAQRENLIPFQLSKDLVVEQLKVDFAIFSKVKIANDKFNSPKPKTTTLLDNHPYYPIHATMGEVSFPIGLSSLAIEQYFSADYEQGMLIRKFLKFSEILGVALENTLQNAASLHLEHPTGNMPRYYSWVTGLECLSCLEFDVESQYRAMLDVLIKDKWKYENILNHAFADELRVSLELLLSRNWMRVNYYEDDQSGFYNYLRWYTRFCITSLIVIVESRFQAKKTSAVVLGEIKNLLVSLLIHLLTLEERINGKQVSCESIKLVQDRTLS